jgi:hypothetical protein
MTLVEQAERERLQVLLYRVAALLDMRRDAARRVPDREWDNLAARGDLEKHRSVVLSALEGMRQLGERELCCVQSPFGYRTKFSCKGHVQSEHG